MHIYARVCKKCNFNMKKDMLSCNIMHKYATINNKLSIIIAWKSMNAISCKDMQF